MADMRKPVPLPAIAGNCDVYARVLSVTQYGRGPHLVHLEDCAGEATVRTWDLPPAPGQIVKLRLREDLYQGQPQAWIVRGRLADEQDDVPELDPRRLDKPGNVRSYRETVIEDVFPFGCCGDTDCPGTCADAEAVGDSLGFGWYVRSLRRGHDLREARND